ncbi:MAG: hypothetical protein ABSA94_03600 [Acidobacteriaceae bacterium]|jgi:hypothetical protein
MMRFEDRVIMKYQSFVAVMVTSCVLASQLGAQVAVPVPHKGSWETVENIPRGTLLAVKWAVSDRGTQTVHCVFHSADETELVCGHWSQPRPSPFPVFQPSSPDRYVFPREQLRQVRIENEEWQSQQSSFAGALAGATLGGVVGYNCCGVTGGERPVGALGLSLAGALVGGTIGRVFPFLHGQVIYEL